MIISKGIENIPKTIYNPKSMKQIEREKIKTYDMEIAKRTTNPLYFNENLSQLCSKINLRSHIINHNNSILNLEPNFQNLQIENRYLNEILRKIASLYAGLKKQNKFNYRTVFAARSDKQDEDGQMLEETDFYTNLNFNHNLTESDIERIDVSFQLEQQIQKQVMKSSGWRFDKINSRTKYFYKNTEMKVSSYKKVPLSSSANLKLQNDGKFCFLWSFLASFILLKQVFQTEFQLDDKILMN